MYNYIFPVKTKIDSSMRMCQSKPCLIKIQAHAFDHSSVWIPYTCKILQKRSDIVMALKEMYIKAKNFPINISNMKGGFDQLILKNWKDNLKERYLLTHENHSQRLNKMYDCIAQMGF